MEYANLRHQAASLKRSLFDQVEDLQDEVSPNFAEEVVSLFFKDSGRLVTNIEQAMEKYPEDFNRWDAHMQQLKGSCFRGRKPCLLPTNYATWVRKTLPDEGETHMGKLERQRGKESKKSLTICFMSHQNAPAGDICIGSSRRNNECTSFRNSCGEENSERCMRSFQKVKREHAVLRQKMESYFQLLRQSSPAGTASRPGGK